MFVRLFSHLFKRENIYWGSEPILNYKYWSAGASKAGFSSKTIVSKPYLINSEKDFDKVVGTNSKIPIIRFLLHQVSILIEFTKVVLFGRIVAFSCNGFLLWQLGIPFIGYRTEYLIFSICKIKTIVIPYGADGYIYHRVRSVSLQHALQLSYPEASRNQKKIGKKVDYAVKRSDLFLPTIMGADGFGRWDILTPNLLAIDTQVWMEKNVYSDQSEKLVITHAPNHRGVKGTKIIEKAVGNLIEKGYGIEFKIIENVSNNVVRQILTKSDIHIDQIISSGYGLNAIESMSVGTPVMVAKFENEYDEIYRRWSFLNEAPVIMTTPETFEADLEYLINNASELREIGKSSRSFVEKFHSIESFSILFSEIVSYLDGKRGPLIDYYTS